MKTYFILLMLFVSLHTSAQINIQQLQVKNPDMHTVYIGIENEFSIHIPSDVRLIKLSSTLGDVKMTHGTSFILNVSDVNMNGVQFKYILGKNGEEQAEVTDPIVYKIKRVPDVFHLKVGSISQSGKIGLKEIKEDMYIGLDDQNLNVKVPIENIKFSLFHLPSSKTTKDPEELSVLLNGTNSNLALQNILKKVKSGSKLYFEDVVVTLKDGTSRNMASLSLLVE